MLKKLFKPIAVLAAIIVIAVFLDGSVFIIRDVRIEGNCGMEDTDVIRLAGIDMGGKMRHFDEAEVRRNVENTGRLICVSADKELPGTVVITVEQRVPRIVTDYGGSIALMDAEGYVISVTHEMPEGDYLYVTGLSANNAVPGRLIGADNLRIEAMAAVIDGIDATGVSGYISEINVADIDGIYLYSRTGIQVMIGDTNQMENKLIWMKYALIDLEGRGETSGKLDVTGGNQADYRAN